MVSVPEVFYILLIYSRLDFIITKCSPSTKFNDVHSGWLKLYCLAP